MAKKNQQNRKKTPMKPLKKAQNQIQMTPDELRWRENLALKIQLGETNYQNLKKAVQQEEVEFVASVKKRTGLNLHDYQMDWRSGKGTLISSVPKPGKPPELVKKAPKPIKKTANKKEATNEKAV